jgi:hypothetical protein
MTASSNDSTSWVPARYIAETLHVDPSTVSIEIERNGPLAGVDAVGEGRSVLYFRVDVDRVARIMKRCRLRFGAACRVLAELKKGTL